MQRNYSVFPGKSFKLCRINPVKNDGYILNEFDVKLRLTIYYGPGIPPNSDSQLTYVNKGFNALIFCYRDGLPLIREPNMYISQVKWPYYLKQITTPSLNKQTFIVHKLGIVPSLKNLSKTAILHSFAGRPKHEEIGHFLREQFLPKVLISELTGGKRTILNSFGMLFLFPCIHCYMKGREGRLGSHIKQQQIV
jgi:hypothetical protein